MRSAIDIWTGEVWNPFREFEQIFQGATRASSTSRNFLVPVDVQETDSHYLFSLDVPGVSREAIKIEVVDDQLVVTGERKTESAGEKATTHLVERTYGAFQRVFTLPATVDADKIEAAYKDGVLRIAVPKAQAAKPRTIAIKEEEKTGLFQKFLGRKEGSEEKPLN